MKFEKTFSPFKIGKCEIPNRLVVPAMVANMNTDHGKASEQYIKYHEEKAKGGWGLIITEDYRINENAAGYPYVAGLFDESQISSHKEFTDTIHKYESKIFCQIYHAGRQAKSSVNGGIQPLAPSPIPCPWNKEIPHELTFEEIQQLVKDFANTSSNVKKAGFDGLEIHAGHGYLIHEFLSPNTNKRIDEYGGTYENRMRFLKEIMEAVREAVGENFPIVIRFSAEEYAEGGRIMSESRQMLKDFEAWGVDAIHVSQGMYGVRSSKGIAASFFQNHGFNVHLAEEAKELVKVPIITVGRVQDPHMCEDIISRGRADFIAMGRASLADPHFPEKAKEGRCNDIRQCIGCLQGCTASTYQGVPLYCLLNPELGHEFEYDYSKAPVSKKVFIAGGGIAGLEAARGAAIKGHEVHLYEASNSFGGQFVSAAYPPFKGEFVNYPAWLVRQIKELNVNIHMNTYLTADIVKSEKPDKVILTTGGKPIVPNVPGIDGPNVVQAEDVLRGFADTGMNVLVAGGGMVGSETAAYLGTQCKSSIGLIERRSEIGMDMEGGIRDDLKDCLNRGFVKIMTNTSLAGVIENGAQIKQGDTIIDYPCDTVILAIGTRAYNPLEEELKGLCDIVVAGDAVKARNGITASNEGFTAGLNI